MESKGGPPPRPETEMAVRGGLLVPVPVKRSPVITANIRKHAAPSKDIIVKPTHGIAVGENVPLLSAPPVHAVESNSYLTRWLLWSKTQIRNRSPSVIFLGVGIFVACMIVAYTMFEVYVTENCLPAPFIYLTSHNNNNIAKYSRDGCLLRSRVVWYGSKEPKELRGVAAGSYRGHDALFIADSADETDSAYEESEIIVVGRCSGLFQMRPFIAAANAGFYGSFHAYSVAIDNNSNIYASFQHTDGVVGFLADSLKPMSFPSTIYDGKLKGNAYVNTFNHNHLPEVPNGTFVQFGKPGIHNISEQGVRSIAWVPRNFSSNPEKMANVPEHLWIANLDHNKVIIVDSTARERGFISVHSPIGMYYDALRGIVYVGSKSKKSVGGGGAVYGIEINTLSIVKTFTIIGKVGLMHPTGITAYGDTLFVAEQQSNVVIAFNITSERYIRTIIPRITDPVEQIILSNC
jgi:hypothetical protein